MTDEQLELARRLAYLWWGETPDDAELEGMLDNLHVVVTDGVAECSTENTLRKVVQHLSKRPLTELSGR